MFVTRGHRRGACCEQTPRQLPSLSRDTIEAACRLYNQVDEEVHRLVLASNRCLQELESLQALKKLQERGHQSGLQGGGDQVSVLGEVTSQGARGR